MVKTNLKPDDTSIIASHIYYTQLLKATTLLSIAPSMVIAILIIYGRLTIGEGMLGFIAVLFGSIFFAKPYIDDLSILKIYVEQLLLDKNVNMPSLSFLGSVDELSTSVQNLHSSWEKKKLMLETAIAESSIIFDTIPDILMILGHNLNIIKCNKAAIRIFGRKIEGAKFNKIIKEPLLTELILSVIEKKLSQSGEFSITSNKLKRDFQVNIEHFPLKNNADIALVVILHDITESKRTKQMIKDFVANASHEIRTPLTSISGFIENLRAMQEDKKTRKKILDIMHEQSERMTVLLNDLLSLSKAEINEVKTPTTHLKVENLIQSVIRRLENLANTKNMKIIYKSDRNLPEILGDANELSQVFNNLISNAIKYGYNNTNIIISAHAQNIRPESDNDFFNSAKEVIAVCVEDKGEGIAKEHLPHITERFYRVNKSRSQNISGTGLGLAIAKHILNRHRGEMTLESIEGEGSKFTVYLPAHELIH